MTPIIISVASSYGNQVAIQMGKFAHLNTRMEPTRKFLRQFVKTATPQSTLLMVNGKRPTLLEKPKLSDFGLEIEGTSLKYSNERPALKGTEGRVSVVLSGNTEFMKEVAALRDNTDVNAVEQNNNAFLVAIISMPGHSRPVISLLQIDKKTNTAQMLTYSGRSYAMFVHAAEALVEKGIIAEVPDSSIDKSMKRDPRDSGVKMDWGITTPKPGQKEKPAVTVPQGNVSLDDLGQEPAQEPAPAIDLDQIPEVVETDVEEEQAPPAPTSRIHPKKVKGRPRKSDVEEDEDEDETDAPKVHPKELPRSNRPKKPSVRDRGNLPTHPDAGSSRVKARKVKKRPAIESLIESIENVDSIPQALELVNTVKLGKEDCVRAVMAALSRPDYPEAVLNNLGNLGENVGTGWAEMDADQIQEAVRQEFLYSVEDSEGTVTLLQDLDDVDNVSGYERGYVFYLLLYTAYDGLEDMLPAFSKISPELVSIDVLNNAVDLGTLSQEEADQIEDTVEVA